MTAAASLVDSLRTQVGNNAFAMLAGLLQHAEIVSLIGPSPEALLAELRLAADDLVDARVRRTLDALDPPQANDPRLLTAFILRVAPIALTEFFARHAVSAADVADYLTSGSLRPAPPNLDTPGTEVLIECVDDDYTPMDVVVEMLESQFGMTRERAVAAMLRIHREGALVIARLPGSDAFRKLEDAER